MVEDRFLTSGLKTFSGKEVFVIVAIVVLTRHTPRNASFYIP